MTVPAIVVVGSLHHDVMVEAPRLPVTGETLAGTRWYPKFGGKGGNQALAAHQTGIETRLLASVGDDDFGTAVLSTLHKHGVNTQFVQTLNGVGTGMSVALVDDDGDNAAVIVSGANAQTDIERLEDDALWDGAGLLLLQNEVPEHLNLAAAQRAKGAGLVVCINAAPARQLSAELQACIDVLIVNAIEAEALCGIQVRSMDGAQRAAAALNERFEQVIVTAGGAGAAVATRGSQAIAIPAVAVTVVSTHGAGDVFTGTLCAELVRNSRLDQAAQTAGAAAARHVGARQA